MKAEVVILALLSVPINAEINSKRVKSSSITVSALGKDQERLVTREYSGRIPLVMISATLVVSRNCKVFTCVSLVPHQPKPLKFQVSFSSPQK